MPFSYFHQARRGDTGGFCGRGQRRGQGRRRLFPSRSASNRRNNHVQDTHTAVPTVSHRKLDGHGDPCTSSSRGSGIRGRGYQRSHSTSNRPRNRNLQSYQRARHPDQSHSRRHRSQEPNERYPRHRDDYDGTTDHRFRRSRDYSGPSNHQYGPQNQFSNRPALSENPDFWNLVKATNSGARLLNHMDNWQHIPVPINRAIDDLTDSIRPPLMDQDFHSKIQNISEQFKANVHRTVNQHLIIKYAETRRTLSVSDDTDINLARQVARKQLLRSNRRINANRADSLINSCHFRYEGLPFFSTSAGIQKPSFQQTDFPTAPVPTSNRFEALQDLGDVTDQMEVDTLIDLLETTMTEPDSETVPATNPNKRPASRRSPNVTSPAKKLG